jgi:flagellar hook-associated protein 1 FlgK
MNLDVAANVARQALIATQQQIALSGRNVAAAGEEDRSRAVAVTATTIDGGIRVAGVRRAEDAALFTRMVNATAATADREAVLGHLTVMADLVGDPQNGKSPAALLGDLRNAVAEYANAPDDPLFGRNAVERARDLANALNRGANALNLLRERADKAMHDSVAEVNRLLGEFDKANDEVVRATVAGEDASKAKDRRDATVAKISEHLGVSTLRRANDDMALFTDGGITLFDRTARAVAMERTPVFNASTIGGMVTVDGLAITGPDAPMPSEGGSIVGHARVRDEIAPTYRRQLDEIARAVTELYEDGAGSLFLNGGAPDHAGTIVVNPAVDPAQGGSVEAFRDGTGNPSGFAAYADRLLQLGRDIDQAVPFDPDAQIGNPRTLADFATGSIGWLESQRATVTDQADTERAVLASTSEALSRATGVNLDDEYALQLEMERSFAASSRLIGVIDEMFETLLRIA